MKWSKWREFWWELRNDPMWELFRASIRAGVSYDALTQPLRDEHGSLMPWVEKQRELRRAKRGTGPEAGR